MVPPRKIATSGNVAPLAEQAQNNDFSNQLQMPLHWAFQIDMGSSLDGTEVSNATDFPVSADAREQPDASTSDAYASRPTQGEVNETSVGAGPPLVGSEFTKQGNWPQRVLQNLSDFLHALTPDGRMMYVSPSCTLLTGWEPADLIGHFIVEFVHPDDVGVLAEELQESATSGNPVRFFYRFRKSGGAWAVFETHGHPHLDDARTTLGSPNETSCYGFFMVARPYPTKNAALLDSFLEQKIVNERLMRRLAELRREDQQERDEEGQSTYGPATTIPLDPRDLQSSSRSQTIYAQMGSPTASMNDKMWTYEGANHLETIEMLTGLRFADGEHSQGTNAGDVSAGPMMSNACIQTQPDRKARGFSGKKKRMGTAETKLCEYRGTLGSPEWRKGPNGLKTLCNACGLRWAKKKRKQNVVHSEKPAAVFQQQQHDQGRSTDAAGAPDRKGKVADYMIAFDYRGRGFGR